MLIKVARAGQVIGEHTVEALRVHIRNQSVLPTDHYWHEGMSGWELISSRTNWGDASATRAAGSTRSRGRVLDYSLAASRGVIAADDGRRYEFSGSEWRAQGVMPVAGVGVEFVPSGGLATAVYPSRATPSGPTGSAGKKQSAGCLKIGLIVFGSIMAFGFVAAVIFPAIAAVKHRALDETDAEAVCERAVELSGMGNSKSRQRDMNEARRLFLLAGKMGNPKAYFWLGCLSSQTAWPWQDKVECWKWLTLAERLGDPKTAGLARSIKETVSEPDYWETMGPLTSAEKAEGERRAARYAAGER